MYGETDVIVDGDKTPAGLSPHVRGNHPAVPVWRLDQRSIPACTGKPPVGAGGASCGGVYPRMYGETTAGARSPPAAEGLSPHVRGNRSPVAAPADRTRSIPACTGKPFHCLSPPVARAVYPRMYGETVGLPEVDEDGGGLSPHVRGNRLSGARSYVARRSIPACTGKPALAKDGRA